MSVLRRDFLAEELRSIAKPCQVDGVISVQARQTIEETRWLLEVARSREWIRGVVGWLPLAAPNVRDEMDRLRPESKLRGLRHVIQDEVDDGFMARDDFNRGVHAIKDYGWTYDLLIYGRQLPFSIPFVDRHEDLTIILDHIAKPTIQCNAWDREWERDIRELAKRPHVYCKFSGVATEVRDPIWSVELIQPYWDVVWESFGAERLMFGTDWPVCLLRTEYAGWVAAVEELIATHSADEQEDFWCNNAMRAYHL